MSKSTLKQLQTRLKSAEDDWAYKRKAAQKASEDCQQAKRTVEMLKADIAKIKKSKLVISEHARLRFIERVIGIDMDAIDARILTPEIQEMHQKLGNGKFPNEDCRVVVADNVIVTVEAK